MSTQFRLFIPGQIVADMFVQAQAELPNECCGLLGGTASAVGDRTEAGFRVTHRYPLQNVAASPVRYQNADKDLFVAFRDMRNRGIEHLAIYHSHPTSDPIPSKTDLANNYYGPDVVHLIISLQNAKPEMRAWRLAPNSATEVGWETV